MSVKSGRTKKRMLVYQNYKGFDIIKTNIIDWWYYHGYHKIIDKQYVEFSFCKHGESNRPSMEYSLYPTPKNIEETKLCIDNFIEDNCLYFTHAELNKYVYAPNRKNEWGFNKKMLYSLINSWKKADKRIKLLYEERLTDANFHTFCGYLSEGNLEEAKKWIEEEMR